MNASPEPGPSPKSPKEVSSRLAWAITLGEAILFGGLVWIFADYWIMLPLRFRVMGLAGLGFLAAIGIFRLVRFFRCAARARRFDQDSVARTPGRSRDD